MRSRARHGLVAEMRAPRVHRLRRLRVISIAIGLGVGASIAACGTKTFEAPPTYRDDVAPLVARKCASCHSGDAPAGGWRANGYLDAVGCVDGKHVDLIAALATPAHAGIVDDDERALLVRWSEAGTPAFRDGVHAAAFVDPRSPSSHGRFLRAHRWRPMLDAKDPDACGVCHDGAPARPDPAPTPAPGATACTSCHDSPSPNGGALACDSCHGQKPHAYPPRDACFFPDDIVEPTHAAHVEPSASTIAGVACARCHPTPGAEVIGGTHGDGDVEVWLPQNLPGKQAYFDPTTKGCTTRCHLGPDGKRPTPTWGDATKMNCNDCHGAPPANHAKGACTSCHREANADGTALDRPVLHMNGVVDLGDGSKKCGACHGSGDDPWPSTGAHAAHEKPANAAPVACSTCHDVPADLSSHPKGEAVVVKLSALAASGGRAPTYDATTKTCANVYCHAIAGASTPAPTWTGGASAGSCGACHSIPPLAPHVASFGCGFGTCHGGSVAGLVFTSEGRVRHVDGHIDL
jgi:predicted CxxxxCH...CXXCH cytochrome family protein